MFDIDEEQLARDLGLLRRTIVEVRKKLKKGVDFDFVNRRISYSAEGAAKVADFCGVKRTFTSSGCKSDPNKTIFAEKTPAIVTAIYQRNRKFMEADKGGQKIVIRVRTNENFIPRSHGVEGTVITPEKLVYSGGTLWDFIGKLPRARGVW